MTERVPGNVKITDVTEILSNFELQNHSMIKAAILDDEPRGSKLMEQKLQLFGNEINIAAVYNSPLDALQQINELAPDVLFLDVEMPSLNGFQFLEKLGTFSFEIIFTTAYDQYIMEALHQSAVDYLLKPIDEEHLEKAIKRLKKRLTRKQGGKPRMDKPVSKNKLALPTAEGVHLVEKSAIVRIEALSNYSAFILSSNKKIIVSRTLKDYETLLQADNFLRVNRSSIINLDYVTKYKRGDGGTLELYDGFEIEVSPQRKEELLERLL